MRMCACMCACVRVCVYIVRCESVVHVQICKRICVIYMYMCGFVSPEFQEQKM